MRLSIDPKKFFVSTPSLPLTQLCAFQAIPCIRHTRVLLPEVPGIPRPFFNSPRISSLCNIARLHLFQTFTPSFRSKPQIRLSETPPKSRISCQPRAQSCRRILGKKSCQRLLTQLLLVWPVLRLPWRRGQSKQRLSRRARPATGIEKKLLSTNPPPGR